MKQLLITFNLLIILFIFNLQEAHALLMLEGGASFSMLNSKMIEHSSSTDIDHSGLFEFGLGFEGRLGVEFPFLSLGTVALLQWESARTHYVPQNRSLLASTTYSNTRRRTAYGVTAIGKILKVVRIVGEYFPHASDSYTYAKPKSENPFSQDDSITGTGFGIGGGYEFSILYVQGVFRRFTFSEGKLKKDTNGINSSKYSKYESNGFYMSVGLTF